MTGLSIILHMGVWLSILYIMLQRIMAPGLAFMCLADDDGDIKIAGGSLKPTQPQEDLAEAAAREFLRQKEAGNIEEARGLGLSFADALMDMSQEPANAITQQEKHHQLLLCAYVINRVIAEYSPNSILAQTTLSVFYSVVESASEVLYQHISDTAAFSLYILSERSGAGTSGIGKIYARLSGFEGAEEKIKQGNELYKNFYDRCVKKIGQMEYSLI